MMRDLHRLREIAAVLIHYGWGDLVQHSGLARMLERTGKWVHWEPGKDVANLSQPVRLRLALTELGPTFVKLGQILSTRVDMLGPEWIAELEQLQNRVPPESFDQIRAELEAAYGESLESLFDDFEPEAFAAASIAQVHRARLKDGTAVVVKVRRPDIQPRIEADLRVLELIARLLEAEWVDARSYNPLRIVDQLRRSLRRECDLVKEARNIDSFARNFRDDPTVAIPSVYWPYCREVVNVQGFLDGVPGNDLKAIDAAGFDRMLLAQRGADAVLKMILLDGHFHADPHPGNIIYLPGNRIGILDFGMVGHLTPSRREQIIQFLYALIHKDEMGMLEVLEQWAGDAEVDEDRLAFDITELVMSYDNLSLQYINFGLLLGDITTIMRTNRLALPPDLTLLFKALVSLEGLGHQLDPDCHLVDRLTPFVQQLMLDRLSPGALLARGRRGLSELARVAAGLPRDLSYLLRQARRGRMRIDFDLKRLDHFGGQIERASNRLTMGVMTASLVIGSSIVLSVDEGQGMLGVLGTMGFGLAVFNSLWIVFSIWRSGRENARD